MKFYLVFFSRKLYCSGLLKNKQTNKQKLTLHWIFAIRTGCLLVCVWVEWWLTALTVAHCASPALKADRAVALALEDVRSWCVGVCVSAPIETLGWQSPWQGQQGRRALSVASLDLRGQLSTHTHTHTKLLVQHCEASYGTSTVVLDCESAHTRSKRHEFLIVKSVLNGSNICCIWIRIIKNIDLVYICARFFYAPKKTKTMQLKGSRTEEEVLCRVNRCDLLWPEHTTLLSWVHLQEGSLLSGVQRPAHHLIPHI